VTVAFAAALVPAAFSADVVTGPPSDPLGDVTNAPDVTNVALLHPSPGSALVITVQVANELVLANGSVIEARFDTDMNPSTRSQSGTERLVQRLWNGPGSAPGRERRSRARAPQPRRRPT